MTLDATAWSTPAWRADAEAWIIDRLSFAGHQVVGPIEQPHLRPWATVLRVPTSVGVFWFKANGPGTCYETALLAALDRWRPPGVLPPLALDTRRAWSLLPDAGTSLREKENTTGRSVDLDAWARFLPEYAELQIQLTPKIQDLLDAGVPDFRPARLPARLRDLLEPPEWLGVGTYGPSREELFRLRDLAAEYARWCEELDALGIPATLQHDDLHDANVFVSATGSFVFTDWGDSVVGHPFGSLLMALRVAAARANLAWDAPALNRLRDAYLEPWADRYDRATLRTAVPLALRAVKVGRIFTLRRAFLPGRAEHRPEFGPWFRDWFSQLLEPAKPL